MDLVEGMRVFAAAVETGSFSGAAARLGLSPKLASKYMAELEARLGTQLLHRTTRRLGLTAAGGQLMAQLPDWLDQLDDMTGALREPGRGLSGTIRWYDLRHTTATLLLLADEPAKVVAERLGHSTITLTMDTYSHVLPTMQKRAADKLENMMFGTDG